MSLFAYNLTTAPLALAAGTPTVTLPASVSAGARGAAFNVTGELKALTAPGFALLQAQVAAGDVQFEWTDLPEFNTFTLVVGSAQQDMSSQIRTIYVDPAGNDNNPGTLSLPVATPQRAFILATLTAFTVGWTRVKFAAGSYTYENTDLEGFPSNLPVNFKPTGNIGIEGAPFFIEGDFTNEIGDRTTTAADATGQVVTDGSLALAPDAYKFAWITMLTGANAGQSRMIIANTATAFTVNARFTSGIAIGDTFVVQRDAVTIDCNSWFGFANGFLVGMKGIKIINSGFVQLLVLSGALYLDRCEFDLAGGLLLMEQGVYLLSNANGNAWSALGSLNPFVSATARAGNYYHDGTVNMASGALFSGYCGMRNMLFNVTDQSELALSSLEAVNTNFLLDEQSFFSHAVSSPSITPGHMTGCKVGGSSQIDLRNGSNATVNGLDMSSSLAAAIRVTLKSHATVGSVSSTTPATTYGILVDQMSSAQTGVGGATTVTGLTADVRVGAVSRTYAQLPFTETQIQSIATGAAAAVGVGNNITGLTGMTVEDVGNQITIDGTNAGTYLISQFVSATEVIVAATLVADAGPVTWTLKSQRATLNRVG